MDAEAKQSFIREKTRQNVQDPRQAKVLWSRHAIAELVTDDLSRREAERALQQGELIEDYAALHRVLPDCLVLGWLISGDPIHAVVAVDVARDRILVITVYRPSAKEWRMTGERERDDGLCPLCGGRLVPDQRATIPFVLEHTVVVVKDVPAEVCASCREPYVTGEVTDRLTELLRQLRSLQAEVSVVSYVQIPVAA